MSRLQVITRNDDDEMWDIADQVVEREYLENGNIRWLIETSSSTEAVGEIIPSIVSVEGTEAEGEVTEQDGQDNEDSQD